MDAELHRLPLEVAAVMRGFKPLWLVAGGWAVDLYLRRATRPHADIEVAILRQDQATLRAHLRGWRFEKVVDGELAPWREGECLELPVHELHCFNERAQPPRLEVLLNESRGGQWVYRRDGRVNRPLAECRLVSGAGVPFLSPEIVLLYKSKNPAPKDEQDFRALVGELGARRKAWLRRALTTCDPRHRWLAELG